MTSNSVVTFQVPSFVSLPTVPTCKELLYYKSSISCSTSGNTVTLSLANANTITLSSLQFSISDVMFLKNQTYTGFSV